MKTRRTEIAAANQYHAFRNGWRDGAGTKEMRADHAQHANTGIARAYADGYRDGQVARDKAMQRASKRYGHEPSIMRLTGTRPTREGE